MPGKYEVEPLEDVEPSEAEAIGLTEEELAKVRADLARMWGSPSETR